MDIKSLSVSVNTWRLRVEQEALKREEVRLSEEYEAMNQMIAKIKEDQHDLMKHIPDSSLELEEQKKELFEFMVQTNVDKYENISVSYKTKKAVNVDRAKEVMGQDNMMAYVKLTQKDLKDYADQFKPSDPAYAKSVMDCVEVLSKEATSITIK